MNKYTPVIVTLSIMLLSSLLIYFIYSNGRYENLHLLLLAPFIYSVGRGMFIKCHERSLKNFSLVASNNSFSKGLWIIRISIFSVHIMCLYAVIHSPISPKLSTTPFFIFFIMGLFSFWLFGFGNYIQKIEPNYVYGIHLPWTMKSEQNWYATHRFISKIMFLIGLIMLAATFFASSIKATLGYQATFMSAVFLLFSPLIFAIIYSYRFSKQNG